MEWHEKIDAELEKAKARRLELMPTLQDVLRLLDDCHTRLMETGWNDAMYCPRGEVVEFIELCSTGIHRGIRDDVGFWSVGDTDIWPLRPIVFRRIQSPEHLSVHVGKDASTDQSKTIDESEGEE